MDAATVADLLALPLFHLGNRPVGLGVALAVVGAALALALTLLALALLRRSGPASGLGIRAERSMSELTAAQHELAGRMAAMAEQLAARQGDVLRLVGERLEQVSGRVGQTVAEQARSTRDSLSKLQERLAVIDAAQSNIAALAGQVGQLQAVLSNKQARGVFGEARMAAIVADALPPGAYEFQATLSNGSRPDCLVKMPNGAPPLVVDAKFPLEAFKAMRAANTPERAKAAAQAFRRDVDAHVRAIAGKYLLAGETQDTAFLFVPSEAVFAEIHERHEAVVVRAQRARVVIVSPTLLMLSIQVIQAVLKDHRMRDQAHLVRAEVARLVEEVDRLDERVRKLAGHFALASRDVDEIAVSTGRIARRGGRIADLDLEETRAEPVRPRLHAVE